MARRLNLRFAKDMGAIGAAAGLAMLYEQIAGKAVVDATARDGRISPFDFALQMATGWAPLILAATQSHKAAMFWPAFAGAVMCDRVDHIMIAFGQKALTPYGPIQAGETLEMARRRLGPEAG